MGRIVFLYTLLEYQGVRLYYISVFNKMPPQENRNNGNNYGVDSKDILGRLKSGEVILGDGSYVVSLEKRGYVKAGDWTPEAAVEEPDGVKMLATEFAKAGADVTQTFTFYSTDDWIDTFECSEKNKPKKAACRQINQAACKIAKEVSDEYGTIVAGGITQTETYVETKDKKKVQAELTKALEVLIENDVDLIIVEHFFYIQEMEWAIELCKSYGKPIAATMAIGPKGDRNGVSVGECAVRMAKAGADIIGANCLFDPWINLETVKKMKIALDAFNLKPYLMAQPNAYRCPDCGPFGWLSLSEFPYAIEPRQITRFEAKEWARDAYNLGVRYIGGCCGFEPYLIRAIAEELAQERGRLPFSARKSDVDLSLWKSIEEKQERHAGKGSRKYWDTLTPCTGRPLSAALHAQPDAQVVCSSVLK